MPGDEEKARMNPFAPLVMRFSDLGIRGYAFSISRLPEYVRAAAMKLRNRGCGVMGRDLNSGWNWHPRYQGWSLVSTISTSSPDGAMPEILSPAVFNGSM